MVDIKKCIFVLTFLLNIDIKKETILVSLASLNQYIGHVYDNLAYDEDCTFIT